MPRGAGFADRISPLAFCELRPHELRPLVRIRGVLSIAATYIYYSDIREGPGQYRYSVDRGGENVDCEHRVHMIADLGNEKSNLHLPFQYSVEL